MHCSHCVLRGKHLFSPLKPEEGITAEAFRLLYPQVIADIKVRSAIASPYSCVCACVRACTSMCRHVNVCVVCVCACVCVIRENTLASCISRRCVFALCTLVHA